MCSSITGLTGGLIFKKIHQGLKRITPQVAGADATPVLGRASVENTNGYLNFTNNAANTKASITTCIFEGYGWLDDLGWVAFGTADNPDGPIACNLYTGAITGKAKVLNDNTIIDFNAAPYNSNVKINSSGNFSGFAWSESLGWLNFTGVSAPGITLISPNAPQNPRIYDTSDRNLHEYSITTRWQAPVNLDPAAFDTYIVERSTDNIAYVQMATTGSTGYLDTTVVTGTTYYYRIKARYTTGTVHASTTVYLDPTGKYTTPPVLEEGPTLVTKPSSVSITWRTDREASSYVRITQGNTFVSEQGHSDFEESHAVTITGLVPETNYSYQLRWMDSDGNVGQSGIETLTTAQAPVISEVQITNITLNSALISWKTTSLAQTSLYYGKDINYGQEINGLSGNSTTLHSAEISALDAGTTYHFKIRGTDVEENILISDDYSFSTLPMPEISNVTTQPITDRPAQALKISWTTNVATSSTITYQKNSGGGSDENSQSELKTAHELETGALEDNAAYTMTISGRDQFGNLATSTLASITTKNDTRPPTISDFTVESQPNEEAADTFKVVIAWKTDEPATSKAEFGVGIGASNLTQSSQVSTALDTSHVVVISGLEASQTYQFRAISADSSGNLSKSETQILVTNQPTQTIFDLIMQSLEKAFGWMGKLLK